MRVAVCDDSSQDIEVLLQMLYKYADRSRLNIAVDTFSSGEELLQRFQEHKYKILFIDIYMKGINGIEVAAELRRQSADCGIVFTTFSTDHAIEGFKVKALHYLLKPIQADDFCEAMERCRQFFSIEEKYIEISFDRIKRHILLKDILFVEVFNKQSIIHTVNGEFKTYQALNELEEKIGGLPFLRCHVSYLVNMNYIESVLSVDFQLTTGVKVPIRQANKAQVKKQYMEYLFQKTRRKSI